MILNYLLGYAAFLFGLSIYGLGKISEYKKLAKANPDPNVNFSLGNLWQSDWPNIVRVLLGGLAIVLFLPMLVGPNYEVSISNNSGVAIGTFPIRAVLIPLYFFIGYSGASVVFTLLGKYKKQLVGQVGGDE